MSVTVLCSEDALAIPEEAQHTPPQPQVINFFEYFGTTGCVLGCEGKRTLKADLESKKNALQILTRSGARSARRSHTKDFYNTQQSWFTSSELATSKLRGCGSCVVLSQILAIVFHNNAKDLPDTYSYSVAPMWELKCRKAGETESELTAQLFRHRNVHVHFEQMPSSNSLLGRTRSVSRLKQWMAECLSNHKLCATRSIAWTDDMRPTRLLDVTVTDEDDQPGLRLFETTPGRSYEYVCLSHRWDDEVDSHKTTTQNLVEVMKSINLAKLPGNFRDAVAITRELGIQYLWIDSLCIVQKGDNGQDLGREIAKMGFIYQNAKLTIAAVLSPNSSLGCFMNDRWPDTCLQIKDSNGQTHVIGARVLDHRGQARTLAEVNNYYPLLTRAWVFQERLLSTRLLQCNYGEFSYDCLESWRCECVSSLAPHPSSRVIRNSKLLDERHLVLRGPHGLRTQGAQGSWKRDVLFYWRTLMQVYMQLGITKSADVLPAIGGCAQVLAHHLQSDYVAGLWKETLSTDLLWHVRFQTKSQRRPTDSTAPSWSWASIAMGRTIAHIGWGDRNSDWVSTQTLLDDVLKEVHCEPEPGANPFGRLKTAYLKLNATLYPWYIRYFCYVAKREQSAETRNRPDLYVKRVNHSMRCTTHVEELDVRGALIELQLDANTQREDLPTVSFTGCVNTGQSICALSAVTLLHVLHKEKPSRTFDVFFVLQKIDPIHGKPNCYKRVGLWKLIEQGGDIRVWNDIVRGKIEPRKEEVWLF